MNPTVLCSFFIAITSIILGFIALLKQKTYLDAETSQPVDIEVPIIGRMKTNYPALAFVFLGFCLAFYVVHQTFSKDEKTALNQNDVGWKITGHLVDPKAKITDWQTGELRIFPDDSPPVIDPNGKFEISITLPSGKSFEEKIGHIEYIHNKGYVHIYPKKEYDAYKNGTDSKLESTGPQLRAYKPVCMKWISDNVEPE